MAVVLVCTNWDASTKTCTATAYQELVVPAVLPPLPADEALLIAAGIVSAWAIGFLIRQARRIPETY